MCGQKMLRSENNPTLLAGRDIGSGPAVGGIPPQSYFDKDQRFPVTANQINLATPAVKIARQNAESKLLETASRPATCLDPLVLSLSLIKSVTAMTEESLALYVVPTPLGNLGDITQRAIDILRYVNWVAAEDTRHTALLLKHIGCAARLLPAHQHNEEGAAQQVIAKLNGGESVALVSDAGTPAVSDPGARLVARVRDAGFRVVPLPGACAAVTALSASGLTEAHFLFYGFLPAKSKEREETLRGLIELPYAIVFYEAPHRILQTVEALTQVFGPERTLVMARELTKLFETIHSCPLGMALEWLTADPNCQRGEFVLLVSGAAATNHDGDGERVLKLLLDEGLPVKQAAKLAHSISGAAKNAIYELALKIKKD